MRLAAIDVGSNSVHMVIAEVRPEGHVRVVERVKEMVRLGRRAFTTGRLSAEAMDLAVRAVQDFGRLARARRVDRLRAVATSAVREARNGPALVRRLRRETGIAVRVISGLEEARLIFRAARHALGLEGGPHLLVDVGGGSVELVLVHDGRPLWLRSLPLGVARLTERFLLHDPPTAREVRRLERHLEEVLGALLDRVRHAAVLRAVGTSGTVNTLVAMARAARGEDLGRLHGASASARELRRLRRRILAADAAKRSGLAGIDTKRVDLMPAAAVLLDFILARAGAPTLVACTWALREGLLLDLARLRSENAGGAPARRRRSVEALAARFAGPNPHGRHVARLALSLFDAVAPALALPPPARELLEYAALLHDIGHAIDRDRHHRHSCYLIQNAELLGLERIEVETIAQVARGHRKQAPKPSDLGALPPRLRQVVRGLAALLRVADALDRTHSAAVRAVSARFTGRRLVIEAEPRGDDAELELWAAARRTDLLARLLERPAILRARASAEPAAVGLPASGAP
ncbi:MAG: Ppx/GppA family phosphatase [Deltaproteobacteria bacterium]|nr:MAG: Ppx/GppA family phosphatase [Deltaproteobacteria bacterium]